MSVVLDMKFYASWNYLYYREIFSQRKLRICGGNGKKKFLQEFFARDGAIPWCLHGMLFIQQTVSILENGSIRSGPSFRFHAENSCIKIKQW